MERWLSLVPRHPIAVLSLVALLTAGAVRALFDPETGELRIRIDPSADRLLPEDNEDRLFYERVRAFFGSDETLLLALVTDDIFTSENLHRIERIALGVEKLPGVHHVLAVTNAVDVRGVGDDLQIEPFALEIPTQPEALAELRERVLTNPIYAGSLVSRNGRTAALFEPEQKC